ncbi:MAG: hypothetical protein WD426_16355 [Anditalea sp.]
MLGLLILVAAGFSNGCLGQGETHFLKIKNVKKLHDFFTYRDNDRSLISGHRGGMAEGFPENSIAALENTLIGLPI